MNSGVLLAKENQDLQAAQETQTLKKKHSNKQITAEEGLSIKEGQSLLQSRNQVDEAIPAMPAEPPYEAERLHAWAPPHCSDCYVTGHKQLQYPNHHLI